MAAQQVLVVAPHYDDEVLGCGGLLAELVSGGVPVHVLFLTDGRGTAAESGEEPEDHTERRRREADHACAELGVSSSDLLLPDGALLQHQDELVDGLRAALLDVGPDLLLLPSPLEVSSDHRAAFAAAHCLLSGLRTEAPQDGLLGVARDLRILLWEANRLLYPDLLVDVSDHLGTIESAMACYESQEALHPYLRAAIGLRRYRAFTLGKHVQAAEAYRSLALDDFRTRGLEHLVRHLGGSWELLEVDEGPLVSVVVRTKDRPELLREALASLARQTWRRLEVVVVNDGGATPELEGVGVPELNLVDLPVNQGRAAAANAGVAQARGEYVTFLDDDDLAEADHVETLAHAVQAQGVRVVYSDAAVSVLELSPESGDRGWVEVERRLPYSRDFDPDLLRVDNYLPFNTLLIERSLIREVGSFDAELPFFEDWDFLLRLSAQTMFHHVRRVTCEYRQFRGAGHHVLGDRPRERADFLELKAQIIGRHLSELDETERSRVVARVVDRLRAETVAAEEERRAESARRGDSERQYHELNGRLDAARTQIRILETLDERHRRDVAESMAALADLRLRLETRDAELQAAYDELGRLDALVREMESTRAWRLHRTVQRWKGQG
ncbi:MAG: glycosyltransferase [Thermoanaerobaculia bacterium]|nr:glycosyltransferase [Thermoanaerobaculia bacterium]